MSGPGHPRRGENRDRPAQNSEGEPTHDKTEFSANTARILQMFKAGAAKSLRRVTSLQAFIKAGRKMVMRLLFGYPDEPAPNRPDQGNTGPMRRRARPS